MSMSSYWISSSSIKNQSVKLGSISQNIANMRSPGYKRMETSMQTQIPFSSSGFCEGGIESQTVSQIHKPGLIQQTQRKTDLAIIGQGFFVTQPDPNIQPNTTNYNFTRDGSFTLKEDPTDGSAYLVTRTGDILQGWRVGAHDVYTSQPDLASLEPVKFNLKNQLKDISFDNQGFLNARLSDGSNKNLFKIPIAVFINQDGLSVQTGNSFQESETSGPPTLKDPGHTKYASLLPESIEQANVDITQELTNLMTTQHAYSSSVMAFQTVDTMMGTLSDLRI